MTANLNAHLPTKAEAQVANREVLRQHQKAVAAKTFYTVTDKECFVMGRLQEGILMAAIAREMQRTHRRVGQIADKATERINKKLAYLGREELERHTLAARHGNRLREFDNELIAALLALPATQPEITIADPMRHAKTSS